MPRKVEIVPFIKLWKFNKKTKRKEVNRELLNKYYIELLKNKKKEEITKIITKISSKENLNKIEMMEIDNIDYILEEKKDITEIKTETILDLIVTFSYSNKENIENKIEWKSYNFKLYKQESIVTGMINISKIYKEGDSLYEEIKEEIKKNFKNKIDQIKLINELIKKEIKFNINYIILYNEEELELLTQDISLSHREISSLLYKRENENEIKGDEIKTFIDYQNKQYKVKIWEENSKKRLVRLTQKIYKEKIKIGQLHISQLEISISTKLEKWSKIDNYLEGKEGIEFKIEEENKKKIKESLKENKIMHNDNIKNMNEKCKLERDLNGLNKKHWFLKSSYKKPRTIIYAILTEDQIRKRIRNWIIEKTKENKKINLNWIKLELKRVWKNKIYWYEKEEKWIIIGIKSNWDIEWGIQETTGTGRLSTHWIKSPRLLETIEEKEDETNKKKIKEINMYKKWKWIIKAQIDILNKLKKIIKLKKDNKTDRIKKIVEWIKEKEEELENVIEDENEDWIREWEIKKEEYKLKENQIIINEKIGIIKREINKKRNFVNYKIINIIKELNKNGWIIKEEIKKIEKKEREIKIKLNEINWINNFSRFNNFELDLTYINREIKNGITDSSNVINKLTGGLKDPALIGKEYKREEQEMIQKGMARLGKIYYNPRKENQAGSHFNNENVRPIINKLIKDWLEDENEIEKTNIVSKWVTGSIKLKGISLLPLRENDLKFEVIPYSNDPGKYWEHNPIDSPHRLIRWEREFNTENESNTISKKNDEVKEVKEKKENKLLNKINDINRKEIINNIYEYDIKALYTSIIKNNIIAIPKLHNLQEIIDQKESFMSKDLINLIETKKIEEESWLVKENKWLNTDIEEKEWIKNWIEWKKKENWIYILKKINQKESSHLIKWMLKEKNWKQKIRAKWLIDWRKNEEKMIGIRQKDRKRKLDNKIRALWRELRKKQDLIWNTETYKIIVEEIINKELNLEGIKGKEVEDKEEKIENKEEEVIENKEEEVIENKEEEVIEKVKKRNKKKEMKEKEIEEMKELKGKRRENKIWENSKEEINWYNYRREWIIETIKKSLNEDWIKYKELSNKERKKAKFIKSHGRILRIHKIRQSTKRARKNLDIFPNWNYTQNYSESKIKESKRKENRNVKWDLAEKSLLELKKAGMLWEKWEWGLEELEVEGEEVEKKSTKYKDKTFKMRNQLGLQYLKETQNTVSKKHWTTNDRYRKKVHRVVLFLDRPDKYIIIRDSSIVIGTYLEETNPRLGLSPNAYARRPRAYYGEEVNNLVLNHGLIFKCILVINLEEKYLLERKEILSMILWRINEKSEIKSSTGKLYANSYIGLKSIRKSLKSNKTNNKLLNTSKEDNWIFKDNENKYVDVKFKNDSEKSYHDLLTTKESHKVMSESLKDHWLEEFEKIHSIEGLAVKSLAKKKIAEIWDNEIRKNTLNKSKQELFYSDTDSLFVNGRISNANLAWQIKDRSKVKRQINYERDQKEFINKTEFINKEIKREGMMINYNFNLNYKKEN